MSEPERRALCYGDLVLLAPEVKDKPIVSFLCSTPNHEESTGASPGIFAVGGDEPKELRFRCVFRLESPDPLANPVGAQIKYGNVVKLRWGNSDVFLSTKATPARFDKGCFRAALEKLGSAFSCYEFRLMPRYKLNSQGLPIYEGGHFTVSSVENQAKMNVTTVPTENVTEVNFSESKLGWKVKIFQKYFDGMHKVVKGGDVLRLKHHESGGYVGLNEKADEVKKIQPYMPHAMSRVNTPTFYWQLVKNDFTDGSTVKDGDHVWLKHFHHNTFLRVRPRAWVGKKMGHGWVVDTVDERNDDGLFIVSSNSLSSTAFQPISAGGLIRLQHKATDLYLHFNEDGSLSADGRPQDDDILNIKIVGDDFVSKYFWVRDRVLLLQEYVALLNNLDADSVAKAEELMPQLLDVMGDLIYFCSESDDMNILTREGVPQWWNQTIIGQLNVINLLLNMSEYSYKFCEPKASAQVPKATQDEHNHFGTVLFRLLKQMVMENPENGSMLHKHLRRMDAMVGLGWKVSDTLTDIFKDNKTLLSSANIKELAEFIVGLIRSFGRRASYVQFLSMLCECNGDVIQHNQDVVREVIMANVRQLIPVLKVSSGDQQVITVKFDGEVEETFGDFLQERKSKKRRQMANFYIAIMELFSDICRGRNTESINFCRQFVSPEVILTILEDKEGHLNTFRKGSNVRACNANLLLNLFLNCEPHTVVTKIKYTRIWNMDVEIRRRASSNSVQFEAISNLSWLNRMKAYLWGQITSQHSREAFREAHSPEEVTDHKRILSFFKACLDLLQNMIMYGMYHKNKEELRQVEVFMVDFLIDTEPDWLSNAIEDNLSNGNEKSVLVMEAKETICRILHLVQDMRVDSYVTEALDLLPNLVDADDREYDIAASTLVQKFLDPEEVDERSMRSLRSILMRLVLYQGKSLVSTSLALLKDYFLQGERLAEVLGGLQLLVKEKHQNIYYDVENLVSKLAERMDGGVEEDEVETITGQLEKLCEFFKQGASIVQGMMYNTGVHHQVTRMFDAVGFLRASPKKEKLLSAAFRFMNNFARGNQRTQLALSTVAANLTSYMKVPGAVEAFETIFVNNGEGIAHIKPAFIGAIVSALNETHENTSSNPTDYGVRYLRLLRALCTNQGRIIERTRDIVAKQFFDSKDLLLRSRGTLVDPTNGYRTDTLQELINQKDDLKHPEGRLAYHLLLLRFFATITAGKAVKAELQVQAVYTVEDLLRPLSLDSISHEIKTDLAKCVQEACFHCEVPETEELQSTDKRIAAYKRWLACCATDIDKYIREVQPIPSDEGSSSRSLASLGKSTSKLGASKAPVVETRKASPDHVEYMFNALLPTLRVFFKRIYGLVGENGNRPLKEESAKVFDGLFRLASFCGDISGAVRSIRELIDVMHGKGISGLTWSEPRQLVTVTSTSSNLLKEKSGYSSSSSMSSRRPRLVGKTDSMGSPSEDDLEALRVHEAVSYLGERVIALSVDPDTGGQKGVMALSKFMTFALSVISRSDASSSSEFTAWLNESIFRSCAAPFVGRSEGTRSRSKSYSMLKEASSNVGVEMSRIGAGRLVAESEMPAQDLSRMYMAIFKKIFLHLKTQRREASLVSTNLFMLRALHRAVSSEAVDEEELSRIRHSLCEMGLLEALLSLYQTDIIEFKLKAMTLGSDFLKSGDRKIQQYILTMANDGDCAGFFKRAQLSMKAHRERNYARLTEPVARSSEGDEEGELTRSKELIQQELAENNRLELEHLALVKLLRFIQMCCEGQFDEMQNMFRDQQTEANNTDIVSQLVRLLHSLRDVLFHQRSVIHSVLHDEAVDDLSVTLVRRDLDVFKQLCDTITETIQGPCIENMRTVITAQVCSSLTMLGLGYFQDIDLSKPTSLGSAQMASSLGDAEAAVMTLLYSLFEGPVDIKNLMVEYIQEKDINQIIQNLSSRWNASLMSKRVFKTFESEIGYKDMIEMQRRTAYQYYTFLLALDGHDPSGKFHRALIEWESIGENRELLKEVGMVEIVRDDAMERLYYRIPGVALRTASLPDVQQMQTQIMYNVNRDNHESKIEDFMDKVGSIISMIEWQGHLASRWYLIPIRSLAYRSSLWNNITFLLVVLINILVVYSYQNDENHNAYSHDTNMSGVFRVLGLLHIIFSFCRIIANGGSWAHLYYNSSLEACIPETIRNGVGVKSVDGVIDLVLKPVVGICGIAVNLRFETIYLVASLVAFLTSPFVYCLHLFDILKRSRLLQYVAMSITKNFSQLMWTVVLGVIVIYQFAVIAFNFYPEKYDFGDGNIDCTTMVKCLRGHLDYGFRGPPVWRELSDITLIPFTIDVTYNLFVIMFLSAVISGIIIDTFADMRSENDSVQDNLLNTCFMCGMSRDTLNKYPGGFQRHITKDHVVSHYIYFILYLKHYRDPLELTGQESHILQMIEEGDISWIPCGRSLVADLAEEDSIKPVLDTVERLEDQIGSLSTRMAEQSSYSKDTRSTVSRLERQIEELSEHVQVALALMKLPPNQRAKTEPKLFK